MFQKLFGFGQRSRRVVIDGLYERIVAASRQPVFYAHWGVPDTPLGRFEMIALHMILFLRRVRNEDGAAVREVAQEVTDVFFADVEHAIRELGIGDMGVPKRIKKLARMFYGRAAAYGEAIDADDAEALAAAVARNIRPDEEDWAGAQPLARYALDAAASLENQKAERLIAADISFPDAERER
ncbi:ubiquinol-cytochrome C chaperone family protein [Nitratireductor kimnyeongensis]|uniref:Ubiquinol-cytochrome C chaperone family protein n=1 Tax=Nitratireductor kimnyeongensis TaxID=430679 RepID=A0ABW0T3M5_9HYPH|nr:ubiquinol-cytochrome C chaperone family protein [Nitratireductor kimnyeongensis]QZZ35208.1 ubiquinol-cytochrome C chaperone [Nitratireductor kimnyeongensis]